MEKRQRLVKMKAQKALEKEMSDAKSIVFVDFRGVNVADDTKLRKICRENDIVYKVIKNTIVQRAVTSLGWEDMSDIFHGPTAVALSTTDPAAAPKSLRSFVLENPALKIKGGVLGEERLTNEKIMFLATLPPREELLARVAGAFQSPLTAVARVLNEPMGSFVRALDGYRVKKEKEAS